MSDRRTLLALVATLSLAACGGDSSESSSGSDEDADAVLAAAIDKSSKADSYRAKVTLEADDDDQSIDMSGEMVSNPDSSLAFGKFMASEDGEPAVEMKTVTIDGKQYVQAPALTGKLPEGKRWVEAPEGNAGTMTPKQFMDMLRDSGDIEDEGEETVGGTKTVHLGGPLDMKTLAEYSDNEELEKVVAEGGDELDRYDATIDVWIDPAADQIRKMSLTMKADGRTLLASTAEMLEYGVPLDSIKAPPASQVATAAG